MRFVIGMCLIIALVSCAFAQEIPPAPQPVTIVPAQQVALRPIPQTILVPQVQMVPYQYQQSQTYHWQYQTPLRDLLFGRYRTIHYYSPVQPQQ